MKILVKLSLIVLVFVACSKDDANNYEFNNFVGVWEGKYSRSIGGNMTEDWLIYLKSDSTVLAYNTITDTANAGIKGKGLFTTYDNTVIAIFNWGNTGGYYISAELTPNKNRIAGMWGIGNVDKGDTFLDKR